MKKNFMAAIAAAATVTLGGLGLYLGAPSQYLAFDINPSIELKANRLNQVVSLKGTNEDGKKLLQGYRMEDRNLDHVLEDVVDLLDHAGYFTNKDKNDILLTVKSGSASETTVKNVNHHLADYLEECQIEGRVLDQHVSLTKELKKLAEEHHISAGRMALIEKILAKDDSVTANQLANMRISDLVAYAKDEGISLDALEDKLDHANDWYRSDRLERLEDELDRMAESEAAGGKYDDRYDEDDDRYDEDDHYDEDDRYDEDDYDDEDDREDEDDRDDDHDQYKDAGREG